MLIISLIVKRKIELYCFFSEVFIMINVILWFSLGLYNNIIYFVGDMGGIIIWENLC